MEEDNYNQYIDPDAGDVQVAADRYKEQLEQLNEIFARNYPSILDNGSLYTSDLSAYTISNSDYIISHAGTSGGYTTNVDYNAINELKETIQILKNEVAELKRILKTTIDNASHQEHRKLTL